MVARLIKRLQQILDSIYLTFLAFKGYGDLVIKTYKVNSADDNVVVSFMAKGYRIDLHCFCHKHVFKYPSVTKAGTSHLYSIIGACTDGAPASIKSLFERQRYYPRMAPAWVSDETHLKIMIKYYLDDLINNLDT